MIFDIRSGFGESLAGRELSGLPEKPVALLQPSAFREEPREIDDAASLPWRQFHSTAQMYFFRRVVVLFIRELRFLKLVLGWPFAGNTRRSRFRFVHPSAQDARCVEIKIEQIVLRFAVMWIERNRSL